MDKTGRKLVLFLQIFFFLDFGQLAHFRPMFLSYTPRKHQQTRSFSEDFRVIERRNCVVFWKIWFRSFYLDKKLIYEQIKALCTKKQNYKLIYRTFLFRLFKNSTIVLVLPEDIDELTLHIISLINPIETKANRQLTNFLNNYKDTVYEKDSICYLPQNQVIKVEVKWTGDNEVMSTESRFITKSNTKFK